MKQFNLIPAIPFVSVFANDVNALIPELWANESLAILQENMVAANLVHRDFQPVFAKFGDTVHTRRPGEFVAKRKVTSDSVTVQDATSTDVAVTLDQHVHVSFIILDGEQSLAFKDLVSIYLSPAMLAQARFVDKLVLGQVNQFLGNSYGSLRGLSSTNVKDRILGTRNIMNINKAYTEDRNLIWTPSGETVALSLQEFTNLQDVGNTDAMAEAFLGRKFGFQNWMCQNMSDVSPGNTSTAGAINFSGGYAKGWTGAMVVSTFATTLAVGSWLSIAGDDRPNQVIAQSATLGSTTSITLRYPLGAAVSNSAVITAYTPGAVNNSTGYPVGWTKDIVVSGFTVAPKAGQLVSFGTNLTQIYTVLSSTLTSVLLDRSLEVAIANADTVNIGPAGSYNWAFHKNAVTLVVRPLNIPMAGVGAASAVINDGGLSIRATITYDGNKQGHLVTLDMLCGVKTLDTNLGAVLLG